MFHTYTSHVFKKYFGICFISIILFYVTVKRVWTLMEKNNMSFLLLLLLLLLPYISDPGWGYDGCVCVCGGGGGVWWRGSDFRAR